MKKVIKVNIGKCYTEARLSCWPSGCFAEGVKLKPYSEDLNARQRGSLFSENLGTLRCFELRSSASQYRVGGHRFAKGG